MSVSSRPVIHPVEVEAPPPTEAAAAAAAAAAAELDAVRPRGVRMRDVPGMPGTTGGLALRFLQFFFAVAALAIMASTSDFASVTTFRYFVAAVGLQCLWSLSLALVDAYALLVGRHLRNRRAASVFTIGDGVTSTLTFGAACASAGITVLIGNDMNDCARNYCTRFEMATAMAFLSWVAVSPSFLFNFWTLASR